MLSEADLALVDALQVSPRAPWSLVGATLGIGAATAVRRWEQLVQRRSAWLVAYPGAELTARMVLAFVEVDCAAGSQLDVARALAADGHALTIDYVAAHCDLLIHVIARSLSEISKYVVNRISALPGVAGTRTLISPRIFSEGSRWRVRAISPWQREALAGHPPRNCPGVEFTDLDRRLLLALGEDGRASYAELASGLGVSPSTVRRHLGALLACGAVRMRCEIARSESPAPVTVVLWLRVPPARLETTARSLAMLPEVRLCAAVSGSANLLLVAWLRATSDAVGLESALLTKLSWLEIIDRAVVLRPVKLMGRLLDETGRAKGRVPLDFWAPVGPEHPAGA
jgi:DNA-binding Lrp family transcriptional regulator